MDDKRVEILQPSTYFRRTQDATASPSTQSLTDDQSSLSSTYPKPTMNTIMPANTQQPKQSDIHTLMSPPEAIPYENFSQGQAMEPRKALYAHAGGLLPLSPPVSPATKTVITDERPALDVADPVLYPSRERSASTSQSPLFETDNALVEEHMHLTRSSGIFRVASPPRREEYQLALEFKSTVMSQFNANRGKWLARERAFLLADKQRHAGPGKRRYTTIAPASGVKAPRPTPAARPSPKNAGIKKPRPLPGPRASPGPATIKTGPREDRDFASVPDYSPPVSTLPPKHNSLKVEWKGAPIDLTGDKYYDLLHPDEVLLAANLRLDCATYLTSKRRIFVRRLECLRIGKEFRKTDAQQACKIDVNKASKLWSAFERVGWLNAAHVRQYA